MINPLKLSLIALCAGTLASQAVDTTWTGANSADWSDPGNWNPGLPSFGGDVLIFDTSGQTSPNNDTNGILGGIIFTPTGSQYVLGGNAITLDTASVVNSNTVLQTISLPLVLTNVVTFNTVSNLDTTVGDILVTAAVSGTTTGVTKTGGGTLTFAGTNSFTGGTTITDGLLVAATDNGNYTMSGGSLLIQYGSFYSPRTILFTSNAWVGVQAGSAIYNAHGRYDLYGNIGASGFLWTKFGNGRIQIQGGANHVLSPVYVLEGVLSDGNTGNAAVSGLGTNVITVENGAALRKNNGGIVLNPIVLNGGDGPDTKGALVANQEDFSGLPNTIVATFSNSITLSASSTLGAQYGSMVVAGNISGPGALTKVGSYPLVLSGANDFTGDTTISAGTLKLGSSAAIPGASTNGNLYLNGSSALDLGGFNASINGLGADYYLGTPTIDNSSAIPGTLTLGGNDTSVSWTGPVGNSGGGALSLVKKGSGTASFLGANTYSGSNVVNGGTLEINIPTGTTTGGLVAISDGATLTLHKTTPTSSLQASGAVLGTSGATALNIDLNNYGNASKPIINATNGAGVLAANGTVTVTFNNTANLSVGSFPIIKYSSRTGSGNFVLTPIGGGITALIVTNGNSINLQITSAPITTWKGNVDNLWDQTTTNWTYLGSPVLYQDYVSSVLFDDTALTNKIDLTTTLAPASTLINTTNTYVFGGAGTLSGGSLTKNGSGTLILNTTGNSPSAITIGAGTLQVGTNGLTGDLGSANIQNEATLSFVRSDDITVYNTISGVGVVAQNTTNILTLGSVNTYSGGTLVNQGAVKLGDATALGVPGSGKNLATVASGGSLDINGKLVATTNATLISGTGFNSNGAIYNSGSGTYIGGSDIGINNVSLIADATISATGDWVIGASGLGISGNGFNLTKIGYGGLYLRKSAQTAFNQFVVGGGGVMIESANPFGTGTTLVISNNAWLDSWGNNNGGPNNYTIANNIIVTNGGAIIRNTQGHWWSTPDYDTYTGSVTLHANLTVRNSSVYNGLLGRLTLSGPISGVGGVTKTGPYLVTLSGANTYTGNTTISAGTLAISAISQGGGSYTNVDEATLDVPSQTGFTTVPMSVLALGTTNGSTLNLARVLTLSGIAPITATNLVLTGTNVVLLAPGAYLPGQFPIIKYTTLSGGVSNLALGLPGVRGLPGVLSNNVLNKTIDLVVPAGSPEKWVGNLNNTWDIAGTANWLYNAGSTTYADGDAVTFDDSSSVTNINIASSVSPTLIVVSNSARTYTFTNSIIAGLGGLLKQGTNMLVLTNGANTFSGGSTIVGGTVKMGNAASLGSSGTVTVNPNGALDLNGLTQNGLTVNIIGSGLNGNGTIISSGSGNGNCNPSVINMLGSATIGGPNEWNLRNGAKTLNCPTNAFSLTKVGGSTIKLAGATVSPNLGDIYILGGALNFESASAFGDNTKTVYIGGSGTLGLYQTTVPFAKNLICSNGASIAGNSGLSGTTWNVIKSTVNVVSGTLNIKNNYNNGIIFNGPIVGPAAVWQEWNGYFTTYATNTFTGDVTINGVFTVAGTGSVGPINNITVNNGSGSLVVKDNAVVRSQNLYLTQGVINGWGQPGILAVTGSGVVACTNITLSANQLISFSGRTDGSFNMLPYQTLRCDTNSVTVGNVAVNSGATIWPGGDGNYTTMTCSNSSGTALTLSGGVVSLDVSTNISDLVQVKGNLTLSGSTIRVNYSDLTNGVYTLITYTGTKSGTAASNLKLALNGPHYTAHLDDSTAGVIKLVVDSNTIQPASNLIWAGDGGYNFWDPATSMDWLNAGAPSVFYYGDNVSFTDPGTNPVVNLSGSVTPNTITVNSSANYTFAGSGKITGNGSLTKTNTGALVINTANSYTNGTFINGGTVVLGNSGALWNNTNSSVTIASGGTLDMANFNPNATTINLSGAGVGGNGALIANYGSAAQTFGPSIINLTGSASIGGTNRWDMRNGKNQLNAPTNAYTLTKVGSGFTALVGTAVSTNLGDIYILGGMLGYETGTTGLGNPTNTLYIGSGATLEMYSATVPLNKNIVMSNNATIMPSNGGGGGGATTTQNIISGPIYLAGGNANLNCNFNNGCAISNTISGPGGLTTGYNAYNRFYAPNTYTGDTTIYGGVYLFANSCIVSTTNIYQNVGPLFLTNNAYVNSTYLHDNAGAVIVGGSATILSTNLWFGGSTYLDVSGRTDGTLTLANSQSLRGDTGNYIKGDVVAASSSSITPGGSANIQTMVFSNNLTLQSGSTLYVDVSRNGAALSSDLIKGSSANTVGFAGTLVITNAGPNLLGVGDTFTIATNFATFSGSLVGSLVSQTPWETITWSSPANGKIQVASVVTNTPSISSAVNGSTLSLTWPIGFIGGTLQTNSVGLDAVNAWGNYPGSSGVTNVNITIDSSKTNVFFRLIHL